MSIHKGDADVSSSVLYICKRGEALDDFGFNWLGVGSDEV